MTVKRERKWPRWWRRMQVGARRANAFATLEIAAALVFVVMTIATWLTLNSSSAKAQMVPTDLTAALLVGTLVPAMTILVLLGRRLALHRAAQNGAGEGNLHVRLVFFFSLIAAVPTLLVVVFASWLFQYGVEFWFSDNSRGLLENANKLARGYYEQTQRDMEYESLAMAGDLREVLGQVSITSPQFKEFYAYQILHRKLNDSAILQRGNDGKLSTAVLSDPEKGEVTDRIAPADMRRLDGGEQMVVRSSADRIEALTPIDRRAGIYLFTTRRSDLLSFSQGQRAQNIVRAYDVLTKRARSLQLQINVALFAASLALVGLSIWFALKFADRQVKPLYDLVDAAREVGAGNFSMRVEGRVGADEVGLLNRAFNRMTAQLERQTQALVGANQQLAERRAFIEAILESVTAGIVSMDENGAVQLMNSSAQKLLFDQRGPAPVGTPLAEIAPQIAALIESGLDGGIVQYGKGGELLTLAVRITRGGSGHVITFEDITRQLVDQRQAAWSDVARRIAHEIKNPLTPIQLATERLSRRYRKQIMADRELFEELTSTIIRQVGDLRKMVDEFSSFARLPKPIFRTEDPLDLARQSLFLQEVAHTDIAFSFEAKGEIPFISCDRHQFGQAMTNVIKNATEAVEARARNAEVDYKGRIQVSMMEERGGVRICVIDNGVGLPQDRERIAEPYVTTREKGTGLGLAIVKKIVEEHGGEITFAAGEPDGTIVTLYFARDPLAAERGQDAAE